MNFKTWLEYDDKDFNYYKNLLIGKLSLDHIHGLSQSLDTLATDQLISTLDGLGEFKQLPSDIQDQVIGQIKSRTGTLGDLVRMMSDSKHSNIGDEYEDEYEDFDV